MDDGTLQERLWQGFARLQTLLGGEGVGGVVPFVGALVGDR